MDILSLLEQTLPSVDPVAKAKENLLSEKYERSQGFRRRFLDGLFSGLEEEFIKVVAPRIVFENDNSATLTVDGHHTLLIKQNYGRFDFYIKKTIMIKKFLRKPEYKEIYQELFLYGDKRLVEALMKAEIR